MNKTPPKTKYTAAPASATEESDGLIRVHESVLSLLVKRSTATVDGVIRLAESSIVDSLAEMVGNRKSFDHSITIVMGEKSVAIEVRIVVEYGKFIPDVAKNVQKTVMEDIESMTGMTVERIDVLVCDVDDKDKDKDEFGH